MLVNNCDSPGKRWIKSPHGWEENTVKSEVIAESMHINKVKKIIEIFLRKRKHEHWQSLYTSISAAPVSKCSAKESVEWLQISMRGSRESHGYSTFGELLRRLCITNSLWQEGRFQYVMCLTEVIVENTFLSLGGCSRRNLFLIVDTLVARVVDTKESIRQMNRIVQTIMKLMVKNKRTHIGGRPTWFQEIEIVRNWMKKLNLLKIKQRIDVNMTLTDLPIELQRMIIGNLTDHSDIESMSHVNKTFQHLCNGDDVWRNLCHYHFTEEELNECQNVLEKRRKKINQFGKHDIIKITWKAKYHFMLRRYDRKEEFADPLMLCRRCQIIFWQDTGHPCVSSSISDHEKISPKKLISLFKL